MGGMDTHRIIVVAFLAAVATLAGADYYVTPNGAGERIGSSWEDALGQKQLQSLLSDRVKPGDVVNLGSGTYAALPYRNNVLLTVSRGGTAENPLTITGVDTGNGLPLIQGKWKSSNVRYHAHSAIAIAIPKGAPHVVVRNLNISSCMTAISANNTNLTLSNLTINKTREAIRLNGVKDGKFSELRATRYTKRGFTIEKGSQNLVFRDCHADATGGSMDWRLEAYPFGFQVTDDGNANVHFASCTARNNLLSDKPTKYWNGDGFVVEASARRISYVDCLAANNGDGGWDDKSLAPDFKGCTAIGNKRGFRIWNRDGGPEKPATLTDCLAVNNRSHGGSGSSAGFWTNGCAVIRHSTFHNNHATAISVEYRDRPATVALYDCILACDAEHLTDHLIRTERHTKAVYKRTTLWRAGKEGENPRFRAPAKDWSGSPLTAYASDVFKNQRGRRFP